MLWSAGAVARMLGVSPTTLRTWDRRYGLGPTTREEGRHRRYSEEDVSRLRRMLELTGRGVAPAAAAALVRPVGEAGESAGWDGQAGSTGPAGSAGSAGSVAQAGSGAPAGSAGREPAVDDGSASSTARGPGTVGRGGAGRGAGGGPRTVALGGASAEVDAGVARGFARAAFRLDLALMTDLATELVARDGVVEAWQRVLAPFLVALGEKVVERGSGVEVEHLATEAILGAMRGRVLPVSGRLPALLACAPDEQHSLPLHALGAALAERRVATRHLGPRVPATALLDAVKLLEPRVVVLWAHTPDLGALAPVGDLLEHGREVLLAGPGWAEAAPGARRVGSLSEAVDAVLELNRL